MESLTYSHKIPTFRKQAASQIRGRKKAGGHPPVAFAEVLFGTTFSYGTSEINVDLHGRSRPQPGLQQPGFWMRLRRKAERPSPNGSWFSQNCASFLLMGGSHCSYLPDGLRCAASNRTRTQVALGLRPAAFTRIPAVRFSQGCHTLQVAKPSCRHAAFCKPPRVSWRPVCLRTNVSSQRDECVLPLFRR